MSERTLREELQSLLAQEGQTQPGAHGVIAENNLRRMMRATYGLAEQSLTPSVADEMLATLLRGTEELQPLLPHSSAAPNGHANGWHKTLPAASQPLPSPPTKKIPVWSYVTQRRTWRVAIALAILLLALAAVAGAMWMQRRNAAGQDCDMQSVLTDAAKWFTRQQIQAHRTPGATAPTQPKPQQKTPSQPDLPLLPSVRPSSR